MNSSKISLLEFRGVQPRMDGFSFAKPVDWCIERGDVWAVLGANGSGKTTLGNLLSGKTVPAEGTILYDGDEEASLYKQVRMGTFYDIYSDAERSQTYYQQRWQSTEVEESSPLVRDLLAPLADSDTVSQMVSEFGIENLLEKRYIMLSSGELRKFIIVRMLLSKPGVLVLDNPYIGLDDSSRRLLNDFLGKLSSRGDMAVVMILSDPGDIPEAATHILPLKNNRVLPAMNRRKFFSDPAFSGSLFDRGTTFSLPLPLGTGKHTTETYEYMLDMRGIHISYGNRSILKDLDWSVKRGEKWLLRGANGSGKSTLLSLVCADNPQSYANDFSLFGRRRGTGESIWDIKSRIGYLSPEVHYSFHYDNSALEVAGSGFFDTMGLYRKCTDEQLSVASQWLEVFGAGEFAGRAFGKLSFGEQRLVLLARAFVKDSELLILDEPLHGLDSANKSRALEIIEAFCSRPGKTLIYVSHYDTEVPSCVDKEKSI